MVTFGSGVTSASYPVPIMDGSNMESSENFAVVLTTAEPNVNFRNGFAIVTIVDDERKLFLQHTHK